MILIDSLCKTIFEKAPHTEKLNLHTLNYQTQKTENQSQLKAF